MNAGKKISVGSRYVRVGRRVCWYKSIVWFVAKSLNWFFGFAVTEVENVCSDDTVGSTDFIVAAFVIY